jgi:phosphopantothenoylcysteine decarboxylase/phosphopantothenate--cysteine ligase
MRDKTVIPGISGRTANKAADLDGKEIVVTAGGTQEPLDPVSHISNRSSGKMGYALAEAARDRGARVTLITAPTSLSEPTGVKTTSVRTAVEMKKAVASAVRGADALIMAAAVTDYQLKKVAKAKIKKESPTLSLELIRTPDILGEVKGSLVRVGFAAETEDMIINATKKLKDKKLDLIVANDITDAESGFAVDTNKVTILSRDGSVEDLPLMTKREVAERILDKVVGILK